MGLESRCKACRTRGTRTWTTGNCEGLQTGEPHNDNGTHFTFRSDRNIIEKYVTSHHEGLDYKDDAAVKTAQSLSRPTVHQSSMRDAHLQNKLCEYDSVGLGISRWSFIAHASCAVLSSWRNLDSRCLGLPPPLLAGVGPREVGDRNDEEAGLRCQLPFDRSDCMNICRTYLLDVSRIPAKALYHAKKAAKRPKKPPALMTGGLGFPTAPRWR